MTLVAFLGGQMVREVTLFAAEGAEIGKYQLDRNRLVFTYQVGFV